MFGTVRELIDYKPMVHNMVKREIRGRYKGSALGFLWNFITPIMQILVYILVFSIVFRVNIENYYMYIITGMVPWIFFSDSLVSGSAAVMDNAHMVNKIYFPRSVLPMSVVISKLVNFLISLVFVFIVIAVTGYHVSWQALLMLIPAIVLMFLFTLGITMVLSAIDPYLRDVQYIVNVLMMLMVWVAPIMYTHQQFDNPLFNIALSINPYTYFCDMFHDILYYAVIPNGMLMTIVTSLSILSIIFGWLIFHRLDRDFAEVL